MLGLAGTLDPSVQAAVDKITAQPFGASVEDMMTLFKSTDRGSWNDLSAALLAKGVSGSAIDTARFMAAPMPQTPIWLKGLLLLSAGASVYHGYKRHENGKHPLLWGLGWGLMGTLFPIITPAVGIAQGFNTSLPASEA